MLGLREDVAGIPYDMIIRIKIHKVFSPNIIFKVPELVDSSSRGKLDTVTMVDKDEIRCEQVRRGGEEDGIITSIPKDKAGELLEVIRNRMDRDREIPYHQHQGQPQPQQSIADELMKLVNLKDKGIITED